MASGKPVDINEDRLRYIQAKQLGLGLQSHLCCWADTTLLLAANHNATTDSYRHYI